MFSYNMLSRAVQWFLRSPVELTFLFIPTALALIAIAITSPQVLLHRSSISGFVGQLTSGMFAKLFFVLVVLFLTWIIATHVMRRLDVFDTRSSLQAGTKEKKDVLWVVYRVWFLAGYLLMLVGLVGVCAWLYSLPNKDAVLYMSAVFTDWDQIVGGGAYYTNLIQHVDGSTFFRYISIFSYVSLATVVSLTGFILVLYSTRLFREFFIIFFLVLVVSLPLWYLMPAVSPLQYLHEQVAGAVVLNHAPLAEEIHVRIASASPLYQHYVVVFQKMWASKSETYQSFAITTNPSMHIAWGFLCVWYMFLVRTWLGGITFVFFCCNVLGTLFTLQHYLIDVPTGILVMLLAILVGRVLVRLEYARGYVSESQWFPGLSSLPEGWRMVLGMFIDSYRSFARVYWR